MCTFCVTIILYFLPILIKPPLSKAATLRFLKYKGDAQKLLDCSNPVIEFNLLKNLAVNPSRRTFPGICKLILEAKR